MGIFSTPSNQVAKDLILSESQNLISIISKADSREARQFFNMAYKAINEFAALIFTGDFVFKRKAHNIGEAEAYSFMLCVTKACALYITYYSENKNEDIKSHIKEIHNIINEQLCETEENKEMLQKLTIYMIKCNNYMDFSYLFASMIDTYVLRVKHTLTEGEVLLVNMMFKDVIEPLLDDLTDTETETYQDDDDYLIRYEIAVNGLNEQGIRLYPKEDARNPKEYIRMWAQYYTKMIYDCQTTPDAKEFVFLTMDLILEDELTPGRNCFDCLPSHFKYKPFAEVKNPYIFTGFYNKTNLDIDLRTIITNFPDDKGVRFTDIVMSNVTLLQFALNRCENNQENISFINQMATLLHEYLKGIEELTLSDISTTPFVVYEHICQELSLMDEEKIVTKKRIKRLDNK